MSGFDGYQWWRRAVEEPSPLKSQHYLMAAAVFLSASDCESALRGKQALSLATIVLAGLSHDDDEKLEKYKVAHALLESMDSAHPSTFNRIWMFLCMGKINLIQSDKEADVVKKASFQRIAAGWFKKGAKECGRISEYRELRRLLLGLGVYANAWNDAYSEHYSAAATEFKRASLLLDTERGKAYKDICQMAYSTLVEEALSDA